MYAGGETADQAVRMTLQGIEIAANVAIKLGDTATRSFAATLYSIITDNKKIKGKTRLDNLLKSNKELKVFAIRHEDLKVFCEEAKRYGVLYCVLKEKNKTSGICEIMVRADDASKISRIIDKCELASIDTKAIREAIKAQNNLENVKTLSNEEYNKVLDEVLGQHPKHSARAQDNQFEQDLMKQNSPLENKKISVHKELTDIKKSLNNKSTSKSLIKKKARGKSR